MKGILYAVGVGPGDPELLTLKAVRRMRECPVIAIPHRDPTRCTAYRIAVQAVPEILGKQLVCVDIPMTKDAACIAKSHREGIALLAACLEEGKHVALLTLGDSLIYASSMYLLEGIKALGYETEAVSGIPSFCAAAARFQIPLVKNSEELHILPASYQIDEGLKLPGVKVLMKAGSRMQEVKQQLLQGSYEVAMVENCGMPGERIARSAKDIPEDAGYYSLMIVRNAD